MYIILEDSLKNKLIKTIDLKLTFLLNLFYNMKYRI